MVVRSRIPTTLFGVAALLLLAAGTAGSAQLVQAEPPCGPHELCVSQPVSGMLFSAGFLVAAGLAGGAALWSTTGRLGAAVLGLLVPIPVAIVLGLLLLNGIYPVPVWTVAGPAVAVLALFTVIPLRVTLMVLAILASIGVAAGGVAVFLASAPSRTPIGTQRQVAGNLAYLQRRDPKPADVAALRPAAGDLNRALQDLHARQVSDDATTRQALLAYPTLDAARVHPPTSEKLFDPDTTVVVVLERGSACLIGELGPADESVHVVGVTLDGGCEALYGH
jgi:hypothetical protein